MNPICKTDINSSECQKWMNKVCVHCRELFARETTDTWGDWWHDETPAFYKEVPEMSVYDCNKLKHLLQVEVDDLQPTKAISYRSMSFKFKLWQKLLLIFIYFAIIVVLVLICRFWKLERQEKVKRPVDEESPEPPSPKSTQPESTLLPEDNAPNSKKRKHSLKNWMRSRCRPIFLHNEAALRREQVHYKEKELLREVYTQQNIEKWTKAREKVEKKRRERQTAALARASQKEINKKKKLDDYDEF